MKPHDLSAARVGARGGRNGRPHRTAAANRTSASPRNPWHGDEAGDTSDAPRPRGEVGPGRWIEAGFLGDGHERVAGDVRERRAVEDEPPSAREMRVEHVERSARLGVGRGRVARHPREAMVARNPYAAVKLGRVEEEPLQDLRQGVVGEPVGAVPAREVDRDRVALDVDMAVVLEHRDLAERVQREKRRTAVLAPKEVDDPLLVWDGEQMKQQANAIAVGREREAVEDRRHAP